MALATRKVRWTSDWMRWAGQIRTVKYGMGSRKYKAVNRWKRARKGVLHKER